MKTGVLIDSITRKYVCDCLEGTEVPEGYEHVDSIPPDGLFEPTYTEDGQWVNGLTDEEIEELKNQPTTENDKEKIANLELQLTLTQEENLMVMEALTEVYEKVLLLEANQSS